MWPGHPSDEDDEDRQTASGFYDGLYPQQQWEPSTPRPAGMSPGQMVTRRVNSYLPTYMPLGRR